MIPGDDGCPARRVNEEAGPSHCFTMTQLPKTIASRSPCERGINAPCATSPRPIDKVTLESRTVEDTGRPLQVDDSVTLGELVGSPGREHRVRLAMVRSLEQIQCVQTG